MTAFYKLTTEEVIAMQNLSGSEIKVLLYLRTLAPFSDRAVRITTKSIAAELKLHQKTVSRALKELDRHGFIDLEVESFTATILPFKKKEVSISSVGGQNSSDQNQNVHNGTKMSTAEPKCPERSPEPSPSKGSTSPQTNKTNKTNKTREREGEISKFLESTPSFRDFCLRKAQLLPNVPVLLDSWISANFEELKKLWEKSQTSSGDQNSGAAVETERSRSVVKYPQVQARIDRGELRQDPVFPEGVYDLEDNWWKKADLEGLNHVH